jgi:putative transport protein
MFSLRSILLLGSVCLLLASPLAWADETLTETPPVAGGFFPGLALLLQNQPLLLLMLIVALGMAIGSLQLWGLSLGTSGVLFAAMLLGHFGHKHDWHLADGIGSLGLALFVYAVGLGAGPTFFRTFRDQGKRLAVLALVAGVSAVGATILFAHLWSLPGDLAAGIFAGAMTTTPGLAAAVEACAAAGKSPANASIGYGLAYPIGVVAAVLFAQLLPRLLRVDLDDLGRQLKSARKQSAAISRHLVEIANPAVFGKRIHDLEFLEKTQGQITRVLQNGRLLPIRAEHTFEPGQVVMLVADQQNADILTLVLGKKS